MAKAYAQDFREKVLEDIKQNNLSAREAAKKYKINNNTVYNWLNSPDGHDPQKMRDVLRENKQLKEKYRLLKELVKEFAIEAPGSKKN